MANYFIFYCGLTYIPWAYSSACGGGLVYEDSYFCSTKEAAHSLSDCTFVFAACVSLPWSARSHSERARGQVHCLVLEGHPAGGATPSSHPISPSVEWSDGAGKPNPAAVSPALFVTRMTGCLCYCWHNLPITAMSTLPHSRPLFTCSMVFIPVATQLLCWLSRDFSPEDSFQWLQHQHLFLQGHLEKTGSDYKVCSDRCRQPAQDFVVGDYVRLSGEHVCSVHPSKFYYYLDPYKIMAQVSPVVFHL